MQIWALFWHIRELTMNRSLWAGLALARIFPIIIFSLIGGAVADSFNRTRIMFVTQSFAALVALRSGWYYANWSDYHLAYLYVNCASGHCDCIRCPARQALVPNLVPAKDLPNAFSMTSIAYQTGSILGPALTGFAIAFAGQKAVYYINAVSFLAVIIALIVDW